MYKRILPLCIGCKPYIIYYSLFIIHSSLFILPSSCTDWEDEYDRRPGRMLAFSTDTLTFDTLFSGVGSTTQRFMVYNRNKSPLDITAIYLNKPSATGFRINVDGRQGERFEHVHIRPNDSLFVFVELTAPQNGYPSPVFMSDHVNFEVNGNTQQVALTAYAWDAQILRDGVIFTEDTTLAAERPWLVYDSLVVADGVTVRLAAGATFYMHDRANIIIYGTLLSEGNLQSPVTLRGDRLDEILDSVPYDNLPAQWGGMHFRHSPGNWLQHTIIRNTTGGITCHSSTLSIENSQITHTKGNILTAINSNIDAANTELSNATGTVAHLIGGVYSFMHCTFANHIRLFRRDTASFTLSLANALPDSVPQPLEANFYNCLIDGNDSPSSYDSELRLTPTEGVDFRYLFDHCVIKAHIPPTPDEHFIGASFIDVSPVYRMIGRNAEDKYAFDFRPDTSNTVPLNMADPRITPLYPTDRYDIPRPTPPDSATVGAYQINE